MVVTGGDRMGEGNLWQRLTTETVSARVDKVARYRGGFLTQVQLFTSTGRA